MKLIQIVDGKPSISTNSKDWQEFTEWVKTTKLYNVIVQETNTISSFGPPTLIGFEGVNEVFKMSLTNGVVIKRPEDLPIQVLIEFYRNSPFYEEPSSVVLTPIVSQLDYRDDLRYRDDGGTEGG